MATFTGTSGGDNFAGTSDNDTFDLTQGGSDAAQGLDGNDIFVMGAALDAADKIDGGALFDRVQLNGDYNLVFLPTTIVGIEQIDLANGHNYSLKLDDANLTGGTFTVAGGSLGAGFSLNFDGSLESTASLRLTGGAGDDTLIGGAGRDKLVGGNGNNLLSGGAGNDTLDVTGTNGANNLNGGAGNDTLLGNFGTGTTLAGKSGDDIVTVVGPGNAHGGSGNDTLILRPFFGFSPVNVDFSDPTATSQMLDGKLKVAGFENIDIQTSGFADHITTGAGNDRIDASNGDDVISAGGGNDVIFGGPDHNTIDAGDGNDEIHLVFTDGTASGDTIDGGAGMDSLVIQSGVNQDLTFTMSGTTLHGEGTTAINIESVVFQGWTGNDHVTGGDGDDQLNGGEGNNILSGGGGDDTLSEFFKQGNNTLNGGSGNDTLTGGLGQDTLLGGDGNDVIICDDDGGSPSIDGGKGFDSLELFVDHFTNGPITFDGSDPNVEAQIQGTTATVKGIESFRIFGTSQSDVITTGNGNDEIGGFGGGDILNGGGGDDFVYGQGGTNVVNGGDGNDTLQGWSGQWGSSVDTLNGGNGDDTLSMYQNTGSVDGGAGTDQAIIDQANQAVDFTAADPGTVSHMVAHFGGGQIMDLVNVENFEIMAANFSNITAGNGNDVIDDQGGGDYSVLNGGGGNDTIGGGFGTTIDGGTGIDTAIFNLFGAPSVTLHMTSVSELATIEGVDSQFVNVENITINAADGNDELHTAGGDDTLSGGRGDNILDGGDGDDLLSAGSGNDVFIGGAGIDTVSFTPGFFGPGTTSMTVNLLTGTATGPAGNDTLSGIENITGGSGTGNDTVIGDDNANQISASGQIFGNGGDDVLSSSGALDGGDGTDTAIVDLHDQSSGVRFAFAGAGTNSFVKLVSTTSGNAFTIDSLVNIERFELTGGSGSDAFSTGGANDILTGNAGDDHLSGGGGDDILHGGLGADALHGGGGRDTFVYDSAADSTSVDFDTISGFAVTKDGFDLAVAVTGVDTAIGSGALNATTFDADLSAAVNGATLAAHHAVLFTADAGAFDGKTFLIVDSNGIAGYQTGQDLVIEIQGKHLDSIGTANFV